MKQPVALTGIRPSAGLTRYDAHAPLGKLITLQKDHMCLLMIADYHALKTDGSVGQNIQNHVRRIVLNALAAGFDVDRGICFLQSQVPQLSEFASILGNLVTVDQLKRPDETGMETYGFLGHSLFQVADILMFRPACISIGKNQKARMQLARNLAANFNERFGGILRAPDPVYTERSAKDGGFISEEEYESRRSDLQRKKDLVRDILHLGCSEARIRRQRTLDTVKEAIGFDYGELLG